MKRKRDIISLENLSKEDILRILEVALSLKHDRDLSTELLKGKTIGLMFQKPSNRTRVSFEIGIFQLGGNCIYLGPNEINLGVRESTSDVAKTLSRYLDGIVARTNTHEDLIALAQHSTIPVINGLSDLYHPCQALADLFSIQEKFSRFDGLTLAFVGDGNNVCHSLMLGCSKMGINMNVATPPGYEPNERVAQLASKFADQTNVKISISHTPEDAVRNANIIYADVWTSMGQEDEAQHRLESFKGFQINERLASLANSNFIFMHCLPAHRGEEVTSEIIDGAHSIVFDQAENRLHTQKAILNFIYNTW